MHDIRTTARHFDRCVQLDGARREVELDSMDDNDLVRTLRALLDAHAAAERDGFLTQPGGADPPTLVPPAAGG